MSLASLLCPSMLTLNILHTFCFRLRICIVDLEQIFACWDGNSGTMRWLCFSSFLLDINAKIGYISTPT